MIKKLLLVLLIAILVHTSAFAAAAEFRDIKEQIAGFDGKVGIYAQNLKTRKSFGYNENEMFPAASTSKLVVAMGVYKYLYPGASQEKKELYDNNIRYMIIVSDNASFYELLEENEAYKLNAFNKVIKDLRLKKTQIHSEKAFISYGYHSVTTPYEMAKVLETIYRGKYLGREKSVVLKDELANTIFQDEIPRHMLTPVMHKIGQLDDVLCDVGIVDDGKDQILISIYTKTDYSESYASDFIADMSARLYNALRRK